MIYMRCQQSKESLNQKGSCAQEPYRNKDIFRNKDILQKETEHFREPTNRCHTSLRPMIAPFQSSTLTRTPAPAVYAHAHMHAQIGHTHTYTSVLPTRAYKHTCCPHTHPPPMRLLSHAPLLSQSFPHTSAKETDISEKEAQCMS